MAESRAARRAVRVGEVRTRELLFTLAAGMEPGLARDQLLESADDHRNNAGARTTERHTLAARLAVNDAMTNGDVVLPADLHRESYVEIDERWGAVTPDAPDPADPASYWRDMFPDAPQSAA
ncbi:MAG TPA: hypothetical protein VLE73_00390 [Candidatus Saccharimonadales bacterium]|nr:hypothetical protein [Candidatus Saccharimonadales bacterium]